MTFPFDFNLFHVSISRFSKTLVSQIQFRELQKLQMKIIFSQITLKAI